MIWRALICLVVAMLPLTADAGDAKENLRGLSTFWLTFEPFSPDARSCGFDQRLFETKVRTILGQSKIKLVGKEKLSDGFVEVYVSVLKAGCVASVAIEVSTPVRFEQTGRLAYATVWRSGALAGSEAAKMQIETLAKDLVGDWNSMNP